VVRAQQAAGAAPWIQHKDVHSTGDAVQPTAFLTTTVAQLEVPIVLAEYLRRMVHAPRVASVVMNIANVDLARLSNSSREAVSNTLVTILADIAGVPGFAVRDLRGIARSVSLSSDGSWHATSTANARRLSEGAGISLLARTHIHVPPGTNVDEVLGNIRSVSAQRRITKDVLTVSGVRQAFVDASGMLTVDISGRILDSAAFLAQDWDSDGHLDLGEFIRATGDGEGLFDPPLSREQAQYVFHGLDTTGDGKLTSTEFAGTPQRLTSSQASSAAVQPAPTLSAHGPAFILMDDFKRRMLRAFGSPRRAFGTAPLSLEMFTNSITTFKPPLNAAQAKYAFSGFDFDSDGSVRPSEIRDVFEVGHFFPSPEELKAAGAENNYSLVLPMLKKLPFFDMLPKMSETHAKIGLLVTILSTLVFMLVLCLCLRALCRGKPKQQLDEELASYAELGQNRRLVPNDYTPRESPRVSIGRVEGDGLCPSGYESPRGSVRDQALAPTWTPRRRQEAVPSNTATPTATPTPGFSFSSLFGGSAKQRRSVISL